jgi:hypothetical protein
MGMQDVDVIAELVETYNAGLAAHDAIGDKPVTLFDTCERVTAERRFNAARRQFADLLDIYATRAAIAVTGRKNPAPAAINVEKQRIYGEFQAAIR